MQKRTILISRPCHLSIQDRQLKLQFKTKAEKHFVPMEDLGFVLLENQQISCSQHFLQLAGQQNIAVCICGEDHLPNSLLLPLSGHHIQHERFTFQLSAGKLLLKKLWKQTVKEKVSNQARHLEKLGKNAVPLFTIARRNNPNAEGHAARLYWKALFGDINNENGHFFRDRMGPPPNHWLNYGYAIARAAIARALVGAGLLPTLGIHHSNRYNAFCLADDILEPYRPFVDEIVYEMWEENPVLTLELNKNHKARLLSLLNQEVFINGKFSSMQNAMQHTAVSLAQCYQGLHSKIQYPILGITE